MRNVASNSNVYGEPRSHQQIGIKQQVSSIHTTLPTFYSTTMKRSLSIERLLRGSLFLPHYNRPLAYIHTPLLPILAKYHQQLLIHCIPAHNLHSSLAEKSKSHFRYPCYFFNNKCFLLCVFKIIEWESSPSSLLQKFANIRLADMSPVYFKIAKLLTQV